MASTKFDRPSKLMTGASFSADGKEGFVPAPSAGDENKILKGNGTWQALANYSLPLAADGTRGGVQIGYTQSGKNYPVQLSGEKMYVNVPWTDTTYDLTTMINGLDEGTSNSTVTDFLVTQYAGGGTSNTTYYRRTVGRVVNKAVVDAALGINSTHDGAFYRKDGTWVVPPDTKYTLPLAANGTRGGVQIGYTQSGKNYPVQLSSEKMYVNVPWENTWRGIQNNLTSTSTSDSLSAAQGKALNDNKLEKNTASGIKECSGGGQNWYFRIATINITATYINRPIVFEISQRGYKFCHVQTTFASANSTDPGLGSFVTDSEQVYYIKKVATSKWEIYGKYSEQWGSACLHRITGMGADIGVTVDMVNIGTTAPSDVTTAGFYINAAWAGNGISNITRSGTTFTVTRANGTTFTFDQQDNNTTYSAGSGLSLSGTTFSVTGVKDYNNSTVVTFGYSTAGMTSTSWLGSWDGYKLRAISPANALSSAGGAKASEAIKNITRSGTTFTATRCDGTTFTFTQQDNNTTYSFTDKNVTLAWGTKSTIATVGGTDIHVTMPANPNTNTWRGIQDNLTSTSTTDSLSAKQGNTLKNQINDYIQCAFVSAQMTAGNWSVAVTAPVASGYKFLCWVHCQSDGWVGSGAMANANAQTATCWTPTSNSGSRAWKLYYLVIRNNL